MVTLRHVTMETRGAASGSGRIVASTASVDRYGDVIDQASMQLDRYKRNPVLLYGHEWSGTVIGNAKDVGLDVDASTGGVALAFAPTWDDDETNPVGRRVARQWGRFLHAVSIGGYAHRSIPRTSPDCPEWARGEGGQFLADFELLEISVVPIPANPDVGQRSATRDAPTLDLGAELSKSLKDPDFWRSILTDPDVASAIRVATVTPAASAVDPLFGVLK